MTDDNDKPCNGWRSAFNVLATEIERLEAQRDELAGALRTIANNCERYEQKAQTLSDQLRNVHRMASWDAQELGGLLGSASVTAREALKKAGCA